MGPSFYILATAEINGGPHLPRFKKNIKNYYPKQMTEKIAFKVGAKKWLNVIRKCFFKYC